MPSPANVQSTEAITATKAALGTFAGRVDQALAMIDLELRRVLDWLQLDRPRYWKNQVRLAGDGVTEARAALTRCLMYPIAQERPSCYEEREALKRAQQHQEYCLEKSERLKHWTRQVQHELFEYEGRISQLVELVEHDVPTAMAVLGKLLDHLERYQAVRMQGPGGGYDPVAVAKMLWDETNERQAARADATAGDEETQSEEPGA